VLAKWYFQILLTKGNKSASITASISKKNYKTHSAASTTFR